MSEIVNMEEYRALHCFIREDFDCASEEPTPQEEVIGKQVGKLLLFPERPEEPPRIVA